MLGDHHVADSSTWPRRTHQRPVILDLVNEIDHRDFAAVQLVGRFKQLKAVQLHQIGFYPASLRACQRSLESLRQHKFVTPLRDRTGSSGGNPPFVWVLDTEGIRQMPEGYKRQTSIRHHTIEIAETFAGIVKLDRAGQLTIISYLTEPECHERIGDNKLESDLYIEVGLPNGQLRHVWLELDMGVNRFSSESDKHIKDKLRRYVEASHDTGTFWPDYLLQREHDGTPVYDRIEVEGRMVLEQQRWFPKVVWLVQNEWRARVLQRLISQLPEDDRQLFKVCDRASIAGMFS